MYDEIFTILIIMHICTFCGMAVYFWQTERQRWETEICPKVFIYSKTEMQEARRAGWVDGVVWWQRRRIPEEQMKLPLSLRDTPVMARAKNFAGGC